MAVRANVNRGSNTSPTNKLNEAPAVIPPSVAMPDNEDEDDDEDKPERTPAQSASDQARLVMEQLMGHEENMPFVDTPIFSTFIGVAIVVSSILMGVELDHDLGTTGQVLNVMFALTWLVEMILRIRAHGFSKYIAEPANKLDFGLVWISCFDAFVAPLLELILGVESGGFKIFTVLRIMRLLRIVRVLRVLTFFRELWLLVKGMCDAVPVLGWVMLLILIEHYVGALVMTTLVGKVCDDEYGWWDQCNEFWGTVPESMFTLFQLMTLDSWGSQIARPILRMKPYMIVFFIFFLFISTFGTMNLVVGVLVDNIFQASAADAQKLEKAKERRQRHELNVLKTIFAHADCEGDGTVNLKEFLEVCARPDVQLHFENLEIPVGRSRLAQRVFEVLDAECQGQMSVDQFIARTSQLKTEGKRLQQDQTLLLMDVRHLARRIDKMWKWMVPNQAQAAPDMKRASTVEVGAFASDAKDAPGDAAATGSVSFGAGDGAGGSFVTARDLAAMESRLAALLTEGLGSLGGRMEARLQAVEERLGSSRRQVSYSREVDQRPLQPPRVPVPQGLGGACVPSLCAPRREAKDASQAPAPT